jgi:hypothetical protein
MMDDRLLLQQYRRVQGMCISVAVMTCTRKSRVYFPNVPSGPAGLSPAVMGLDGRSNILYLGDDVAPMLAQSSFTTSSVDDTPQNTWNAFYHP